MTLALIHCSWSLSCSKPPNCFLVAPGGNVGVLLKRSSAAARHFKSNIYGYDAIYGYPSDCDLFTVHVSSDWIMATRSFVSIARPNL